MAKLTKAGIEYLEPAKFKLSHCLFTATEIRVAAAEEEYEKGGVELNLEKLGLTDGLLQTNPPLPTTPGLQGPVGTIWCNPLLAEVKLGEFKKGGAKAFIAQIDTFEGKNPVLTIFGLPVVKEALVEATEAEAKALGKYYTTVFAFGK